MLAFTSGTTGKPKAAVHTHRDVLAACETWPRHVLQATPDDIVMGSPPLAFTFGLGGLLVFPMWAGASVYYPDIAYTPAGHGPADPRGRRHHLLHRAHLLPPDGALLQEQMAQRGAGALRICVSAGEGLPDATRQLWKSSHRHRDDRRHWCHRDVPHLHLVARRTRCAVAPSARWCRATARSVVDDDGVEVPRGTVGKLAVIGPTGCKYLDDARQANYVKDGWNYPGDAFMQDADGYFFYQARADDMIITAGYNVGAPEVEDALLKHPAVAECGVVGVPDEERGMLVKAFCVLKAGEPGDAAQVKALQDHVKASIAPYKYPREVVFVDKLPRTETGKLQRFKLKQSP